MPDDRPVSPEVLIEELCRRYAPFRRRAGRRAYGAMRASEYVGGPTEREAWRTVLSALWPFVTNEQGMTDPGAATTKEGR